MSESVHDVAAEVAQKAEARGQLESARQLRDMIAADAPETTVVVVGETNQGKSSLVNALLGIEVSPVDFQVATSAYVVLRHGSSPTATVQMRDGRSTSVPVAELADWVTTDGEQSKEVQAVELEVESPLLERGLTLIDTPGVGGLSAVHAKVTQAALVHADAVLFVLDPEAPISAPELGFLEQVTERIGAVLFVLTKTDAYDNWEVIRDANLELLAKHVPRFKDARFIPVSSTLKQEAEAAAKTDPEYAEGLREESGLPALQAELGARVVGHARELRCANLVALSTAIIAKLRLLEEITETPDDPELERRLVEARERLQELAKAKANWALDLMSDVEELAANLEEEADRRILDLRRHYDAEIALWEDGFADRFPDELQDEIDGLAADLEGIVAEGVADMLDRLAKTLGFDDRGLPGVGEQAMGTVTLPTPVASALGQQDTWSRLAFTLFGSAAGGAKLGLMAGPIGAVAGGAAGLLAGVFLGKLMQRHMRKGMARREAQIQANRLLIAAIDELRVKALNPQRRRVRRIRIDLDKAIREHIERRDAELQEELKRHQQEKRASTDERNRAAGEARNRRKALDALERRLLAANEARTGNDQTRDDPEAVASAAGSTRSDA